MFCFRYSFPLYSRLGVQNARGLCWLQHPNLWPLPPEGERPFLAWRLCEVRRLPAASVGHMLLPQPATLLQTWLRKVSPWPLLIPSHLGSGWVHVYGRGGGKILAEKERLSFSGCLWIQTILLPVWWIQRFVTRPKHLWWVTMELGGAAGLSVVTRWLLWCHRGVAEPQAEP